MRRVYERKVTLLTLGDLEPAIRLPQSRGCGKGSEKSAEAIVAEMPFSEGPNRFCAAELISDPLSRCPKGALKPEVSVRNREIRLGRNKEDGPLDKESQNTGPEPPYTEPYVRWCGS